MSAAAGWQDFEPKQQQGWQDYGNDNPAAAKTEFEKARAPEKREGGIKALGKDLLGFLMPSAQNPYPGMGVEQKQTAAEQSVEDDARRKSAGYSPAYRAIAPVAQSVGLNVNGMEHAAEVGDESGVWGHALAPAVAYGMARGTGAAAGSRAGRAAGAGIVRGAKAALPEVISKPFREVAAGARESWQASAPKPRIDALSQAVPAETDALSEAASGKLQMAPKPRMEPQFLSDQESADYGLQGGMEFPAVEDARVANSGRMLNEVGKWRRERALYDPVSYQEGPTPEQAQATRDFFHSPLKNWNGDPIAVRSKASEYAPADLSQDLTPALEESLRRVRLAKERAGATKKGPTRGEKQ